MIENNLKKTADSLKIMFFIICFHCNFIIQSLQCQGFRSLCGPKECKPYSQRIKAAHLSKEKGKLLIFKIIYPL
jgi:hypothetical protein